MRLRGKGNCSMPFIAVPELTPDRQERLAATDGTPLYYQEWRPSGADLRPLRGLVLIVHGFGEHGGRFARFARKLNAAGFQVATVDHRGMGQSGGVRGHVLDYSAYVEDLAIPERELRRSAPSHLPLFIYGHSMGGLIAFLHAVHCNAAPVAGTILSGPLLGIAMPIPAWQVIVGRQVVRFAPTFKVPAPIEPRILTHDPEMQAMLGSDPLGLNQTTLGWFFASGAAMERAKREVGKISWPTLWLIAGEDRLCSPAVSRTVFSALPSLERHTWRDYPGLFHELHQECAADRDRVCADVVAWMEARLARE